MRDYTQKAKDLVLKMTLEEKVSQMIFNAESIPRLGVKSYNWWNEALHGVARSGTATVFPQAIALAATFDPSLVFRVGEVISTEGRAKFNAYQKEGDHDIYKGLTFWSPNINIFRDPRWGRGHETYGEDPYLTGRMGVAFIRGVQGDDPELLKAAANAKHYAVHSGPETERHGFNAEVSDYDLWNTYLPAFEAAVKEGKVEAVMGAYNRTNGEPCCGSKLLIADILRGKWGFEGHFTSDCGAIMDFHLHHKVTDTAAESAALAVKMGCDLNCGTAYANLLPALSEGLITEEDIDKALVRLFAARFKLGIANETPDHPYTQIPFEAIDCDEHQELNMQVTGSSLVLLKNDGILPLNIESYKSIGIIGPNADSRTALEGNYMGTASDYKTVLQGLQILAEQNGIRTYYAEGSHLFKDRVSSLAGPDDRLAEALAVARKTDLTVLCVGLDATIEGEEGDAGDGDKPSLTLPECQRKLMEKVREAACGKPVVVVVLSGSALDLRWADEHCEAILQAFYPGALGGLAIASAMFGLFSPQGKLPVTFYKSDKDLPDFRDYSMKERTYKYFTGEALYPFGYGIGYCAFEIEGAAYSKNAVNARVINRGPRDGVRFTAEAAYETVQVYAKTEGTKERWVLCGFEKICLKQGERAEVVIDVSPKAFARYDSNGDLALCSGKKTLYVGFGQPCERNRALTGQKPYEIAVE